MAKESPRLAYVITETEHDENGYIPCLAVEGERGYHRTDWHWDCDLKMARELVDDLNKRLGLTKRDADVIIAGTMRTD